MMFSYYNHHNNDNYDDDYNHNEDIVNNNVNESITFNYDHCNHDDYDYDDNAILLHFCGFSGFFSVFRWTFLQSVFHVLLFFLVLFLIIVIFPNYCCFDLNFPSLS